MDLPRFGSFEASSPEAFYLGSDPELMCTADGVLVVEGHRLRVHSQVLSLQCKVVRTLLAARLEGRKGLKRQHEEAAAEPPRGSAQQAPAFVLEQPLAAYDLASVVHFVRLCYHPEHADANALQRISDHLPGMLRLAHQLNAPALLNRLQNNMAAAVLNMENRARLLEWVAAAEECQLRQLWCSAIRRLIALMMQPTQKPISQELGQSSAFCSTDYEVAASDISTLMQVLSPDAWTAVLPGWLCATRAVVRNPGVKQYTSVLWEKWIPKIPANLGPK